MAITLLNTIGYAVVNAMNPCALAALVMILITILLANENKKYKILLGGICFTIAVFIGYTIYGIIIIQAFKTFNEFMTSISVYMKYILAILAIILGIFNIKDYISYKPGGIATEMPVKFRPFVKIIIKRATSPLGAFLVGLFITMFLLPCTMGPYIIALGNVYNLSFFQIIPHILLFNFIFTIPMLIITFAVYFGVSSAEKVGEWRDRNIRRIHLIAGIILLILGIAMLTFPGKF
jgi:cytochrome c biogenesis protein CcdA